MFQGRTLIGGESVVGFGAMRAGTHAEVGKLPGVEHGPPFPVEFNGLLTFKDVSRHAHYG